MKTPQIYLITSKRLPDGLLVVFNKDRHGVYWLESWQKCRPEDESKLNVYSIAKKRNLKKFFSELK